MKKSLSLFILSLLILNIFVISFVNADPPLPTLPGTGEVNPDTGLPPELDKLRDIGENLTDEEARKQYLSQEWKKMPMIAPVDAAFTKASIVFLILFGQHYSFSLKLFIVIILWCYFLFLLYQLIKVPSGFKNSTNFFISLLLTIILAQIQIFSQIAKLLNWFMFTQKTWIGNIIIAAIEVGVFIGIYFLAKYVSQISETQRKAFHRRKKEAEDELKRRKLQDALSAAQTAFGGNP